MRPSPGTGESSQNHLARALRNTKCCLQIPDANRTAILLPGKVMIAAKIDPVSTYARMQPGATACTDLESGKSWTYAALDRDVDRTAGWLAETLGPASGTRIATLSRNCAEMLMLQL